MPSALLCLCIAHILQCKHKKRSQNVFIEFLHWCISASIDTLQQTVHPKQAWTLTTHTTKHNFTQESTSNRFTLAPAPARRYTQTRHPRFSLFCAERMHNECRSLALSARTFFAFFVCGILALRSSLEYSLVVVALARTLLSRVALSQILQHCCICDIASFSLARECSNK